MALSRGSLKNASTDYDPAEVLGKTGISDERKKLELLDSLPCQ